MANQPAPQPLTPTFEGYIASTMDALILFEACLTGHLFHVPRRPHDRERADLIKSGNIFIYEESSSGIKRWTDSIPWSPSRILGNFLLYRELDKPFLPGEKKRAMKRNKSDGVNKSSCQSRDNSFIAGNYHVVDASSGRARDMAANADRAFVGSLVDSYQFRPGGLIKKTISVEADGVMHHLVSYYTLDDVKNNRLRIPSTAEELANVMPRTELISCATFRAPVDQNVLEVPETSLAGAYPQVDVMNFAGMNPMIPRPMSILQTNPYGQTQPWSEPRLYSHGSAHGIPQTLQAPVAPYDQQMMPYHSYDTDYGSTPGPADYNPGLISPHQQALVHRSRSSGQISYPVSTGELLMNGNDLGDPQLSSDPYATGDIFSDSVVGVAAHGAQLQAGAMYAPTSTMPQSSGTMYAPISTMPQSSGALSLSASAHLLNFDEELHHGLELTLGGRATLGDFQSTLPDSNISHFETADDTIGNDDAEEDEEWSQAMPDQVAEGNMDPWP